MRQEVLLGLTPQMRKPQGGEWSGFPEVTQLGMGGVGIGTQAVRLQSQASLTPDC